MIPLLHRTVPAGVDFTESFAEWDEDFKTAVVDIVRQQQWRFYPQTQPAAARERLADHFGIDPERITFTRGADAAIDDVIRHAAATHQILHTPNPAYPGYDRAAQKHQPEHIHYDADSTTAALSAATRGQPATVIMTWPGNPTGTAAFVPPDFRPGRRWVLDATYLPLFSDTFARLIHSSVDRYDVIFSCSKTYGLAGIRLGGIIHDSPPTRFTSPAAFELDYLQLATADIITRPEVRRQLQERDAATRALQIQIIDALRSRGREVVYTAAASFITITATTPPHVELHAKHFRDAHLTRVTTCPHNLEALK
ncbi:hypothetical protein ASF83_04655 [Plantibacter sp. Leaf171]|uniref:aminotransferase class I/II-fold pyridoxal phosphate-dependent enzyme n=1 Tax=unclassified Plantibacter TaxID=2624265 RepID=UPI0006F4EE2D|nr:MULTISPECIES: aminotransferase class I/II-fold pyridoxal phosphate-dependent enzyme [unclassified Plantibacter]KQM15280.1 hypothetical protein ASE44_04670 [Plantibacter sp. Leaf1]KQR58424.1 hypothetical protein ASF83_04655 [Plantibacter sp. Leaf171]